MTYQDGELRIVKISPLAIDARTLTRISGHHGSYYVAVSHVWGDGLDNPRANALPNCQISRPQVMVNKLFPVWYWPVPFWIDTLCVPIHPSHKKQALKHLDWIYKSATKVLVLARTMLRIITRGMNPEEIGLRVACSGWVRRLWTLQEGVWQTRVHYQFADNDFIYYDLKQNLRKTFCMADGVTYQRKISSGHFLNDMLDNAEIPKKSLDFPFMKYLNPSWPVVASFFKNLMMNYKHTYILGANIEKVIRTIMSRTTSKLEDESICFVSLIHRTCGSAEELLIIDHV